MGLVPSAFRATQPPGGATIRAATAADFEAYLHVDSSAFGESPDLQAGWLRLLLGHHCATVAVAELDGEVVASGHVVTSDGRAGPAAYVGGIGVLPHARRRGIGAAVSSWLVAHAIDHGARLAHLHPDTEHAAGIYRRLGFVEVDGFDIYLPSS